MLGGERSPLEQLDHEAAWLMRYGHQPYSEIASMPQGPRRGIIRALANILRKEAPQPDER